MREATESLLGWRTYKKNLIRIDVWWIWIFADSKTPRALISRTNESPASLDSSRSHHNLASSDSEWILVNPSDSESLRVFPSDSECVLVGLLIEDLIRKEIRKFSRTPELNRWLGALRVDVLVGVPTDQQSQTESSTSNQNKQSQTHNSRRQFTRTIHEQN